MAYKTVLIILLIICTINANSFALSGKQHNELMEDVLFDSKEAIQERINGDSKANKALDSLEFALYLCIDQHNSIVSDQLKLDRLIERHKIKWHLYGLPTKITKTDFGGNDHRKYTHKGWNYDDRKTGNDRANWETRKQILLGTVTLEFGFPFNLFAQRTEKYDKQCDAFCEFLYHLHILGDHKMSIDEYQQNNGGKPGFTPYEESADMESTLDLVNGLITAGDSLFISEKTSQRWKDNMRHELSSLSDRFELLGQVMLTEKEFECYMEYHEELWELLTDDNNTSSLLKDEDFFANVFYAE